MRIRAGREKETTGGKKDMERQGSDLIKRYTESPPFYLSHPSISQKLTCAAGAGVYLLGGGEMPRKSGLPPPKSSGQ